MSTVTYRSETLRAAIGARRDVIEVILRRYYATSPRLFGSVARGDAAPDSDIDLLVDLLPGKGNELLRLAGLSEELTAVLGVRVDVVSASLLRSSIAQTALRDAVTL